MVLLVLPILTDATRNTLQFIDTLICFIFLFDFFGNLRRAESRRGYFLHGGGWLDLLGSIPSIPALPWTAILRLARLGRLARILRFLRAGDREDMWADFKANRAESALYVTIFIAIVMITISSIVVLQFESRAENPNIVTGGDAFWWAFVTITTVGYGDRFPTTGLGRFFAMILMVVGVGIFGVLTSFLSAAFITPPDKTEEGGTGNELLPDIHGELQQLRQENAEIKASLAEMNQLLRGQ
jgi:voltage-gated potassium channel